MREFLRNPYVDKCLGILCIAPEIYLLYVFSQLVLAGNVDIYRALFAANFLILVVSVLFRRTAQRVSLNPLFWLITAARTYWAYIIFNYVYVYSSGSIAPLFITQGLLILSVAVLIYARLSLGRNIGFIPAQREIVTTGAYGFVRHPIQAGELVFFLSYMLASFTPMNFFLLMLGAGFLICKGLIEERFLQEDAGYRAYCERVRWRWIPGLI